MTRGPGEHRRSFFARVSPSRQHRARINTGPNPECDHPKVVITSRAGLSPSLLLAAVSLTIRDRAEADEVATFVLLCALVSLGMLAIAGYLISRRVPWIGRRLIYLVGGACLVTVALSSYE
jgi:hypothetical protein